jgi:hypothetical protein
MGGGHRRTPAPPPHPPKDIRQGQATEAAEAKILALALRLRICWNSKSQSRLLDWTSNRTSNEVQRRGTSQRTSQSNEGEREERGEEALGARHTSGLGDSCTSGGHHNTRHHVPAYPLPTSPQPRGRTNLDEVE